MPFVRDTVQTRAITLSVFVGVLWVVRVLDMLVPGGGSVAGHGIVPRTWVGLEGIPTAPLIHASLGHLIANTVPLLVLGALVLLRGTSEFVFVVLASGLIGGAGVWLFGAGDAQHVGASGVIFGMFGYLVFRTAFDRRLSSALITIVVALLYGTAMVYALVPTMGISWTSHCFGFVGGIAAARMRYPAARRLELAAPFRSTRAARG